VPPRSPPVPLTFLDRFRSWRHLQTPFATRSWYDTPPFLLSHPPFSYARRQNLLLSIQNNPKEFNSCLISLSSSPTRMTEPFSRVWWMDFPPLKFFNYLFLCRWFSEQGGSSFFPDTVSPALPDFLSGPRYNSLDLFLRLFPLP